MAIICGTDYSPSAADAATIAALLASRLEEPLFLLYALDELADFRVDPEAARAYESVFELARKRLPAEAERLRAYGAKVEQVFVTGAPDEALVGHAARVDARLIVLASSGRRGVSRWLLGSVAERTLRSSQVPVLVVRTPGSLEQWLRGERALHVMVGTDLSTVSDDAVRWATGLRTIGACRITIVHAASADVHETRALERDLRQRMQAITHDAEIGLIVHNEIGTPGRYLARLASTEQADLLVVGSRQRTGLDRLWQGTVAGEALSLAQTNVACVPALAAAQRRAEPIPEIRTVLAATDFSKLGNSAVAHAYALVAPGGVVYLVHVFQSPLVQSTPPWTPSADLTFTPDSASEHHLAAQLAALIPDEASVRGIVSRLIIVDNRDVAEGICGAATRLSADAICMGTHGRSWLAESVVGSVTHGVVSHARIPVLVVPPPRDV